MAIHNLKRIPPLTERDMHYQLYRGFIAALSTKELCEFIDLKFRHTKLERKLILDKLSKDIARKCTEDHETLFLNLVEVADQQETFHQKMYCASFIEVFLPYVPKQDRKTAIKFLLDSKYVYNRRRAYFFLESHGCVGFRTQLVNNWKTYQEMEILPIFLKWFSPFALTGIFENIWSFYQDWDWLDYHGLLLRNRLVAKTAAITSEYMDKLRELDPVSFIFAMKELGKPVEDKFALDVFEKDRRGFLLAWFGEMRLEKVLSEIQNNESVFSEQSQHIA